jgi:hypothetical protein
VMDHIDQEGTCRSSVIIMNISWGGVITDGHKPEGCFFSSSDQKAYFNADTNGIMDENDLSSPGGVCRGCRDT